MTPPINELAAVSGHRRHWRRMPQQEPRATGLCRLGLHKWTLGLDVDFGAYREKNCRCGAKALVPIDADGDALSIIKGIPVGHYLVGVMLAAVGWGWLVALP